MIENVVFDMGRVLMDWDPPKLARHFCETDEDAEHLARDVFGTFEWAWLDADAIDLDSAVDAICARLPERLRERGRALAYGWTEYFEPIPPTGELVRELKGEGYGCYILSNAGLTFDEYRERIPAIELFDGVVVSAFERQVKPGLRIFSILCERYGLDPANCLFADDMERNTRAAERAGMHAVVFDGDPETVRRALAGSSQPSL